MPETKDAGNEQDKNASDAFIVVQNSNMTVCAHLTPPTVQILRLWDKTLTKI